MVFIDSDTAEDGGRDRWKHDNRQTGRWIARYVEIDRERERDRDRDRTQVDSC